MCRLENGLFLLDCVQSGHTQISKGTMCLFCQNKLLSYLVKYGRIFIVSVDSMGIVPRLPFSETERGLLWIR